MASFNLANIFFFCFFVYISSVHSIAESDKPLVAFEKDGNYLKYSLQTGVRCLSVQYDGAEVMKFNPADPQPEAVLFTINGSSAIVNFKESRHILRFENGEWKTFVSGKFQPTSMNVLFKDGCERYGCLESNKVYTYIPIEDNLFSRVRYHPAKGKGEVLFETDDPLLFANKVVYYETNPDSLTVSIYHVNGLKRTLVKRRPDKWEESLPLGCGKELTEDNVRFTVLCHAPKGVKFEKVNSYLKYKFEDGVKCIGVEYDGKKVLELDPADSDKPFPISLFFTVKSNTAILNFKTSMDILKLESNGWELKSSGNPKADELDLKSRTSNCVYKYSNVGKVHTYTAVKGHAFYSIKKSGGCLSGTTSIWNADYFGDVVDRVVYDVTDSRVQFLQLHGVNGLVRRFRKFSGYGWAELKPKDTDATLSEDKVDFVMRV